MGDTKGLPWVFPLPRTPGTKLCTGRFRKAPNGGQGAGGLLPSNTEPNWFLWVSPAMTTVPDLRIRKINPGVRNPKGDYVLYFMTAYHRLEWNFALQHSADLARRLRKPLVVLELLRVDYPHASHRPHRFRLQGMAERFANLEGTPVLHYPFVETAKNESQGLFEALAGRACSVVGDDFPSLFLSKLQEEAGAKIRVPLELVDSNGFLPLRATTRVFSAAYHFRRFLQKALTDHLPESPDPQPLQAALPGSISGKGSLIPSEILERWPPARTELLSGWGVELKDLPIDSSVPPVEQEGTTGVARVALERFLSSALPRYAEDRNHPDLNATSGLSPHLHFGTLSSHEVFASVGAAEGWTPLRLSDRADGARSGWWGMGTGAEAFLDQLVTWRELGFNMASKQENHRAFESLPGWARDTLAAHEGDPRPHRYSLEELWEAQTHDPLWNAAQQQLREEGVVHNYLRMLWGKKILQWSVSARDALGVMIELNDRLALDGQDPNSYSGIFWCLGRYDRGWPERPIFGKVRSMTSRSTRRKVKLSRYLSRFNVDSR